MYASYHWGKISKKHYVVRMTVFIVLVSLISAYFIGLLGIFFGFVSPVLSFPFYGLATEVQGSPIPPEGYSYWIMTYRIHFLATEIYSLKPHDLVEQVDGWKHRVLGDHIVFLNMEVGYVSSQFVGDYFRRFSFLFFLLVNIMGALLGYALNRTHRIREWVASQRWGLIGLILGFAFLGLGLWSSNIGVMVTSRNPPWGDVYVEYTETLHPYSEDGFHFFLFGILVLAIVVGRFLWDKLEYEYQAKTK